MILTRRMFTKLALAATASLSVARPTSARDELGCHFFVIGDWGRKNSDSQRRVAKAMSDIASTKPPRFVISTGDNFYGRGVSSDSDELWVNAFENVYSAPALKCPWYAVLGNHDYWGDVKAQTAFSRRDPRWVMPSRYYQHVEPVGASSRMEFLFFRHYASRFNSPAAVEQMDPWSRSRSTNRLAGAIFAQEFSAVEDCRRTPSYRFSRPSFSLPIAGEAREAPARNLRRTSLFQRPRAQSSAPSDGRRSLFYKRSGFEHRVYHAA